MKKVECHDSDFVSSLRTFRSDKRRSVKQSRVYSNYSGLLRKVPFHFTCLAMTKSEISFDGHCGCPSTC